MSTWIAFWNILLKDIKNYYLKPPNISWGLIFPFAWTLMFLLRSDTDMDIRGILPGIIAISILFGTTSMLAVTITFERKSRSFERLLVAPIDLHLLMIAKTLGAIVFGVINAFIPILFSLFWISLSDIAWIPVLFAIFLIAITSTFVGLLIAVSVREVFEAQTFSNFFRFPMIFLCGLFIPLTDIPRFLRPLSYALPLTYGVDILKAAINEQGILPLWLSFFSLVGFALALFAFSMINVKRKWII